MRRLLLLGLIVGILTPGYAATDATGILKKSYEAEGRATFVGRLSASSPTASSQVNVSRSSKSIRMQYLSGSIIIDDGRSVTRLDLATKTAYVSQTPSAREDFDLLLKNYRPLLVGSARIAGRDCYYVRLDPRFGKNPSKRLWIDKKSLVALKTEYYNSDGKVTSSSAYTSVDFAKQPSASLFLVPKGWTTVTLASQTGSSLEAVAKSAGFAPIKPSYAPKGYQFGGYSLNQTCRYMRCVGLRYTNGLNAVSVFESKGACPRMSGRGRGWRRGTGGCPRGSCVLSQTPQGQMLNTAAGELSVVLVGDIPQAELRKMADSIK